MYTEQIIELLRESIISVRSAVVFLLPIIGLALILKKADEPWYAALIPFWSEYILLKRLNKKKWFVPYVIAKIMQSVLALIAMYLFVFVFIGGIVVLFSGITDEWLRWFGYACIFGFLYLITSIVCLAEKIVRNIALSKQMQLPSGFALGLTVLPPIFLLLVGVSDKYQWNHSEDDTDYYQLTLF